jgi:hypothetical protein
VSEIAAKAEQSFPGWGREPVLIAAALALVASADVLLWQHRPGISLFIFYAAIAAGILIARGARPLTRPVGIGIAIALLGALPLIEAASILGLLSATFGVGILALASRRELPSQLVDLPLVLVRYGIVAPVQLALDAIGFSIRVAEGGWGSALARGVFVWVIPVVLALIFVGLFAAANPLIEAALNAISIRQMTDLLDPARMIFWAFVAAFVWPLLAPRLLRWQPAVVQGPQLPKTESLLFGRSAILRALLLFNGLFAVQTALDLTYLWGGVELPQGMTYADYAHRGAYPLIVTALLAAGFVLAAMRPNGAAEQSPLIRNLVYFFVAQNVLLVISSILRLELYVEIYSLTELRVAAGIWMALVAIGLVLILVRIAARKSGKWLIAANLASLGLTLYVCAYIDFSAVIARYNVEHSQELTGEGTKLDVGYLRSLGPTVLPALDAYLAAIPDKSDVTAVEARLARAEIAGKFQRQSSDWRSWTFRGWRLERYLAASAQVAQSAVGATSGDARR